jgi:hypothetical protein
MPARNTMTAKPSNESLRECEVVAAYVPICAAAVRGQPVIRCCSSVVPFGAPSPARSEDSTLHTQVET